MMVDDCKPGLSYRSHTLLRIPISSVVHYIRPRGTTPERSHLKSHIRNHTYIRPVLRKNVVLICRNCARLFNSPFEKKVWRVIVKTDWSNKLKSLSI